MPASPPLTTVAEKDGSSVQDKYPGTHSEKKLSKILVRVFYGILMTSSFLGFVLSGHIWLIILIIVLEVFAYSEIIGIVAFDGSKDLPWSRMLSWYFLITTQVFLNGEALWKFFRNVGLPNAVVRQLANHHRFVAYSMYMTGFVFYVCTLRPNFYRQQYTQFGTIHMALFLVVIQGQFMATNVILGLYWFLLPVSLVIVNDTAAYVCGITVGKTSLIKISPKKTVEGFSGAWLFTMIFGVLFTYLAKDSDYMICPMDRVGINVFSDFTCTPNSAFIDTDWRVPQFLQGIVGSDKLTFAPVYLHTLLLASFASLVAPFGGFFASGLKRALKIKDFGDTIPGHGGIVDRFDCQFVMGGFAYIYYQTFVATPKSKLEPLLTVVANLPQKDKLVMLEYLQKAM